MENSITRTGSVVNIYHEMIDDRFVDINNVTYLITDYLPHPHVYGGPEPAKSILNDEDNKSNLASGRVIEIKNNLSGDVTFYDHDDNDLISVGDEFIINADIIPVGSINGVDFYLIFDAEYYEDRPIFEVMGGIFMGEYTEHVQLTIEKVDGVFNVTIVDIDELFFQEQMISNLSVRIYSKITNSTLFWQNLNDSLENESSLVIFYDSDNNSILSLHDNIKILDGLLENFVFEIYFEYMGTKIGYVESD